MRLQAFKNVHVMHFEGKYYTCISSYETSWATSCITPAFLLIAFFRSKKFATPFASFHVHECHHWWILNFDLHMLVWLLQALLKLVVDCSAVALNPSRRDTANESPLKIALFLLAKMCTHLPCSQFLQSSELFPVIGRLQQSPETTIANYASVIINKVTDGRLKPERK